MDIPIVSLLKVAPKRNNNLLCDHNTLYLSRQLLFNDDKLTRGQNDDLEGAISRIPCRVIASECGKINGEN